MDERVESVELVIKLVVDIDVFNLPDVVAEASVVESVETLLFIVLIESFKNDFDVVDEINDGMEL